MIRAATHDDLDAIVAMAEQFVAQFGREFVAADAEASLRTLIDSPHTTVLVFDRGGELLGMVGAVAFPEMWNLASGVCQELFWWVQPVARGEKVGNKLLDSAEQWARRVGANRLVMAALEGVTAEGVGGAFERRGYRKLETNYVKELV